MWKQMDSAVDGIVGRMVSGARVMKGMIGDFTPHNAKQGPGANALDYLPTETTRVKYIIRNPHTKETKVITMRPSKKVVKLMAMTPKSPINEKPKTTYVLDAGKLRQLERDQELIAEGKMPAKHEERPFSSMQMDSSPRGKAQGLLHTEDDIVRGTGGLGGSDFNESWKPVFKQPTTHNARPAMSPLHTSIVGELLPQPQKQVYRPSYESEEEEQDEQDSRKPHMYEVNEYTAEESVIQPLTHEYHSYKNAPVSAFTLKGASHRRPHETQNEITHEQTEHIPEYRAQRGFVPSRNSYRTNFDNSTVASDTTITTTTTTTTEEPNYPASFLKRYREKQQTRSRPKDLMLDDTWLPSNVSYSNINPKSTVYHQTLPSPRIKSQKWPSETEETLNTESSHEVVVVTESLLSPLHAYESHTSTPLVSSVRNTSPHSRKNVRLKTHQATTTVVATSSGAGGSSNDYPRHRNSRHRGSIRFGDKLETEEG
uniref:Uncharacterized protein n=1 Tax=Stomoxys calcitrans TaxID=35570 RepID=A0A1I8NS46_STOCA